MNRFGADPVAGGRANPLHAIPERALNSYLAHISGPEGVDEHDMVVDASLGDPSIFGYTSEPGITYAAARVNVALRGMNPTLITFGTIAALSEGMLMQVVDAEGTVIAALNGERPITRNMDFLFLAGVDVEIITGAGANVDVVTIRYTMMRAGASITIKPGETFRFVIQDDLTGIAEFRAMIQGYRV